MKIPDKAIIKFEYSDENREYIFDIKELYDIIKEKQLIINKAIEYVENNICGGTISNGNELLKLLKGEENDTSSDNI